MSKKTFWAPRFIEAKRDKHSHSVEDIQGFVNAVVDKDIAEYQISAWLMAALLNGLSPAETSALTIAMSKSGKTINWNKINSKFSDTHLVDKHSTGGVGDKVSLVLAPLAAAMGMTVPMMSGQGLAQTGGTVDKLLSIDGFNMDIDVDQMGRQLLDVGTCMIRQTSDYCPADKTIYALRDVTGTVPSVSLITASILSKKVAEGVKSLVIDLKTGRAAFMKNVEQARELAKSLVRVGKESGLNTHAVLTRMDSPLGTRVGNSLEVIESLEILKQSYPSFVHKRVSAPLEQLCVELCGEMAFVSGLSASVAEGEKLAWQKLKSGEAYEVFMRLCVAQGAKSGWESRLPRAKRMVDVHSDKDGYVQVIDALKIGWLGVELGVGRARSEDRVDPTTGFEFFVRPGDKIAKGEKFATVYLNDQNVDQLEAQICDALEVSTEIPSSDSLVIERVYDL